MKFCLKSYSHGGGARAGTLLLGGGDAVEVETPSLLLSTCKGLPHFVSPDMLPSLPSPDSRLLHLSPLHFLEAVSSRTISKLGGLHQMLGLQDYGFVALPRDSIRCLPSNDGTNKIGASFETPCGRCLIKPSEYVEMISSMRPNIWVTLADEVPAWVSDKRNRTSVDRTLRWMDECISFNMAGGDIFGAIVGGSNMLERQRCAKEVAKRSLSGKSIVNLMRSANLVINIQNYKFYMKVFASGYWIGGFGLGESIEERPQLLKVVCECLPAEKPRLICGLGLPEEILQGVNAGVDLFDSTYIYHITIGGFALTFPLSTCRSEISPLNLAEMGSDSTKINLRSTAYRKDTTPIVEGCECYTCRHHTKAYINHLLNVHEMLAQTLLEIHNTYHFLGFFRMIREAIKGGYFEQFRRNFVNDRRDHLYNGVVRP